MSDLRGRIADATKDAMKARDKSRVGLGMSELILDGAPRSVDISPFRLERFADDPEARAVVLARKEEAARVQRRVERILGAPVDEVLPAGA